MFRRLIAAALGSPLLGLGVSAQAQSATPTAVQESGSPTNDQGSNYNDRSNIIEVTLSIPGLSFEVPEFVNLIGEGGRLGEHL